MFSAYVAAVSHALTLQGEFEFHKDLKVIWCCLDCSWQKWRGPPSTSASEPGPTIRNTLKLHSFQDCFGWQTKSPTDCTMETTPLVIKYILTFIPVS